MAIALGPIVGGFLLEHHSWSSIFYTLGPVSLAVIALVARFVPSSKNPVPHGLDVPGLVLSGGFMGLLVYTIIEAPGPGWTSTASLLGFAGAAVLLIAFIVGHRRALRPRTLATPAGGPVRPASGRAPAAHPPRPALRGGPPGVAVIGSVSASLSGSRLPPSLPATLPHTLTDLVHQSVGAAFGVSGQLAAHGQGAAAGALRQAATSAFHHGLTLALVVSASVPVP